MINIKIFVKYNSVSDENYAYTNCQNMSVLVPINSSYVSLEILYETVELKSKTYTLEANYSYELGILLVKITNDRLVKFYNDLKKNEIDKTKFLLCIDIIRVTGLEDISSSRRRNQ
ncbi:hypothetical protein PanWU01x14_069820 [Parasponia andersonii]|uniref:Uncharacterized protein n=1 Tax=Parasponia andersonii TaxID=3476 RepID=A0A2P5DES5_PARAD|nr:hypothetical protein PanWU01x14_069820 [Parasponia andersonii]